MTKLWIHKKMHVRKPRTFAVQALKAECFSDLTRGSLEALPGFDLTPQSHPIGIQFTVDYDGPDDYSAYHDHDILTFQEDGTTWGRSIHHVEPLWQPQAAMALSCVMSDHVLDDLLWTRLPSHTPEPYFVFRIWARVICFKGGLVVARTEGIRPQNVGTSEMVKDVASSFLVVLEPADSSHAYLEAMRRATRLIEITLFETLSNMQDIRKAPEPDKVNLFLI